MKYRILVVEDSDSMIKYLKDIFKRYPEEFEIEYIMDGEEGLDLIEEFHPNLVLMDNILPGMNGLEVLSEIKADFRLADIPVIIITTGSNIDEAFAAGAMDYIRKPFTELELVSRIKACMDRIKALDKIKEQQIDIRAKASDLEMLNDLLADRQKQLEEVNEHLKKTLQTKDKMFSIIAHDLRNPLHVLTQFTKILVKKEDTLSKEQKKEIYHDLYSESRLIRELLENLLSWAMNQNEEIKINPKKNNFQDLLNHSFESLTYQANSKNISLKIDIEKELEVYVDSNMIDTVFRNLISNAIKFSNKKSVVYIKAKKDGDFALVSIEDSGIGISKKLKNKLFELDKTKVKNGTNDEVGSGLGLILVKEFIEKNKGKLWVESEEGKGSTFFFTLPVSE